MPFNLLLLPLLGGYVIVSRWNRTKYATLRSDGHRLLIFSALAGILLLGIASAAIAMLNSLQPEWLPAARIQWRRVAPFPGSGTAVLSLLLSVPGFLIGNLFTSAGQALDTAIERKGDPFEMLMRRAFGEMKMVAFTVRNGKVYVGHITTALNPALAIESIGIFPQISGYRDATTKKYVFTTTYTDTYNHIRTEIQQRLRAIADREDINAAERRRVEKELMAALDLSDFELVIPIAEIQSVHIFIPEVWERHFAESDLAL
jgi:hypothetical protein